VMKILFPRDVFYFSSRRKIKTLNNKVSKCEFYSNIMIPKRYCKIWRSGILLWGFLFLVAFGAVRVRGER
jgi:hypothetical protein